MNILSFWLIILVSIGFSVNVNSRKLVIDTDGEADDSAAILLTLSTFAQKVSDHEVVGITCVYGNTYENNVEINILKTLTVANSTHQIPVYKVTTKPLVEKFVYTDYFGKNGFSDFEFKGKINGHVERSTDAASALVNMAKNYSGKLDILALGPLTNIATASLQDKNFLKNVHRLYIMGGNIRSNGRHFRPTFNFESDPESTYIVFNTSSSETPYLLYPGQTDFVANISKEWRIRELGSIKSRFVQFLNKAEKKSLSYKDKIWRGGDVITAAVMLWPNKFTFNKCDA
ncbi:hypothetical protein KQX54_008380 [Cotesia glomerata]|uniref:Inosine/uridine-preferring nucleoside hydrolase domain-containing protein n=1 Tax=Cotesia glomerata TaxID=32391 RepID=A0AAV7I519_COTGL|nr:hypothetical protein KQX54_008380 [Cotesia glomerata]